MRAGQMRTRIDLYHGEYVPDASGAPQHETTRRGTFYGMVKHMRNDAVGQELRQNQSVIEIKTRYAQSLAEVTQDDFLMINGQEFEIDNVLNIEFRNRELIITATQRVYNG